MSSTRTAAFLVLLGALPGLDAVAADEVVAPARVSVAEVMPPLHRTRAATQQVQGDVAFAEDRGVRAMLDRARTLRFESLTATKAVADRAAFAEMQEYLVNAYSGLTVSKTIRVGNFTFLCIPRAQQPSLRTGNVVVDSPPAPADAPSPDGIVGRGVESCRSGDIPLEEHSAEELASFQTLDDFLSKDGGLSRQLGRGRYQHLERPAPDGGSPMSDGYTHHHALVTQETAVTGVASDLNLWSPRTPPGQMSLSQVWILGNGPSGMQTIEAGWQVSQWQEADRAVPFIFWTSDDYTKHKCYDLRCSGFVQTTNLVVFARFDEALYSVPGGRQSELHVEVHQHPASGNWWLRLNGIWVGYWPRQLYAGGDLARTAPVVTLKAGGENTGVSPVAQMGSGRWAADGWSRSAYHKDLRYWDASRRVLVFSGAPFVSDPACYTVDMHGQPPPGATAGSYVYFGGPGTSDPRCR